MVLAEFCRTMSGDYPSDLGGVLVLPSNLLISFCNFSTPLAVVVGRLPPTPIGPNPRAPCLSKRYVSRFFFSSANPCRRVNKCVSSLNTICAEIIAAAAASRTTREVVSFNAYTQKRKNRKFSAVSIVLKEATPSDSPIQASL